MRQVEKIEKLNTRLKSEIHLNNKKWYDTEEDYVQTGSLFTQHVK